MIFPTEDHEKLPQAGGVNALRDAARGRVTPQAVAGEMGG
jgi:hypothetical protein